MNVVTLIGRLTRDPEVSYSKDLCISRYSIAVDRPGKDKGADFISCVAFGKAGEFAEKYLHKGMKIAVNGRIQTGDYTDRNGVKRYTFDVIVNQHEFCEKATSAAEAKTDDDWMKVPEGVNDDELPFG